MNGAETPSDTARATTGRVSTDEPGTGRRRAAPGFVYSARDRRRITDADMIWRIRTLAGVLRLGDTGEDGATTGPLPPNETRVVRFPRRRSYRSCIDPADPASVASG